MDRLGIQGHQGKEYFFEAHYKTGKSQAFESVYYYLYVNYPKFLNLEPQILNLYENKNICLLRMDVKMT